MYKKNMKTGKKPKPVIYPEPKSEPMILNDHALVEPEAMVRTQVYLTRREHEFLQSEADRRGEPMAAFLREIIDQRMSVPEGAWQSNPMLEPTPDVEGWTGDEDGALNHDYYAYGGTRKYEKEKGEWVLQPPATE